MNGLTGTVSGLTPGTDYLFRVRPLCNDAVDYASASCHTQCEAITIFPYYESFEDGAFGCWMPQFIVQNGSSWQNHTVNSMGQYPAHGSHYVFYHQSAVNSYSEGLLVSPVFDFSSTPYPKITFSYDALGDGVHNDTLALLYRTSPTDSWTTIWMLPGKSTRWRFRRPQPLTKSPSKPCRSTVTASSSTTSSC